ncbi:ABC transporter permease [Kineococcus rubinsiae]|uniref:ABC transporter permease n=1 Tax=Kineococcus rubinsiae TaxID=2609562 RepID=UPI00143027D7|nr:ABC transporter permease [Kineococcus rubinsiae]
MLTTTLAQVRAHAGRVLASCLAIVIAVGFVVATLCLNASSRASVLDAVGAQYRGSAVVLSETGDRAEGAPDPLAAAATAVAALPGVRATALDRTTPVQLRLPGRSGSSFAVATGLADDPGLRWQRVSAGRLPTGPDEIAVSERTGAGVGTVVTLTPEDLGEVDAVPPAPREVRVVGVVDLRGDPRAGVTGQVFASDADLTTWGAATADLLRVAAAPGADVAALRDAVTAAVPAAEVLTGDEAAAQAAAAFTGDAANLTSVLLVFGAVAVLVAALVIANTFAVLVAQRTRELALLRCVGATSGQVARSVLAEAAVVGVLASAAGVGAGVGLAAAVSALVSRTTSPIPLGAVVVPASAVAVGLVLGTAVTVLAALAPARGATRVAPLAALRPVQPPPVRSRAGALRLALGLVVLVPSAVALVVLSRAGMLTAAVGAGALSFLGVLLLARRLVPAAVSVAGLLVRPLGGVPARLAQGNALRNPRRTAATATALLIGVTLTSAMVVGAASTRATATQALVAGYPTDVVVEGADAVPTDVQGRIAAVPGVAGTSPVTTGEVSGPRETTAGAQGVEASAAGVVRSQQRSPLPRDGEAVLSVSAADTFGVADGGTLPLTGSAGTQELRVRVAPDSEQFLVLTAADLRRLDGAAAVTVVWVRLADAGDRAQERAVDAVTDVVTDSLPSSSVSGVVAERSSYDQLLRTFLLVVTGLLGVAVVIALLGVGNTLALSVVERRQESGLLRALGLTRGQLRAQLAWEALLVAGVAAVLGVVLGSGYGLAGTAAVLSAEAPVVLALPWAQLAGIVAVAAGAGVLASVLPARRAARTSPVAAIAG